MDKNTEVKRNHSSEAPAKTILSRAADNGFALSIYLCGLVLAAGFSTRSAVATIAVWIGTLWMPVYVCRMLRSSYQRNAASFPELWAEGIASFFLATLLPAAMCYVCLRFLAPTYVADTVGQAIAIFESATDASLQEMAATLQAAVSAGRLPRAIDITAQLISLNIIAGTMLSFFAAMVARIGRAISVNKR